MRDDQRIQLGDQIGRPTKHQVGLDPVGEGVEMLLLQSREKSRIALDRSVRILKVVGFCERRGDAAAARVLYDDLQNDKE